MECLTCRMEISPRARICPYCQGCPAGPWAGQPLFGPLEPPPRRQAPPPPDYPDNSGGIHEEFDREMYRYFAEQAKKRAIHRETEEFCESNNFTDPDVKEFFHRCREEWEQIRAMPKSSQQRAAADFWRRVEAESERLTKLQESRKSAPQPRQPRQDPIAPPGVADLPMVEDDELLLDGDLVDFGADFPKKLAFPDDESFASHMIREDVRENLAVGSLVAIFLVGMMTYTSWRIISWIIF